ncbi:MAG: MFS transporter [Flaviflexus sp.]|nr:MFS transporter [Flaviflexus sp.]
MERSHDPKWVTVAVTLSAIVMTLDITIVQLGLKEIGEEFTAGLDALQWIVNGYTLAFASLVLSAGALGDKIGRLSVFRLGITVFFIASLGCALAPSVGVLIAGRIAQGVGAALMFGPALALIAGAYEGDEEGRLRAIVLFSTTSAAFAALGPLFGEVIVGAVGWRAIFYLNIPFSVVVSYVAAVKMDPQKPSDVTRPDYPAAVLATIALFTVNYGLTDFVHHSGITAIGGACLCTFTVFFFVFLVREKKMGADAMIDLRLFRLPVFSAAVLMSFFCRVASFGIIPFVIIWLQGYQGLSPTETGCVLLFMSLTLVVFAAVSMKLTRFFSVRTLNAGGMGGIGLGWIIPGLLIGPGSWTAIIPGLIIIGIGSGLMTPHMMDLAVSSVPAERSGMASRTANTFFPLGTAVGFAVFGAYLSARLGHLPGPMRKVATSGNADIMGTLEAGTVEKLEAAYTSAISEIFLIAGAMCLAVTPLIAHLLAAKGTAGARVAPQREAAPGPRAG